MGLTKKSMGFSVGCEDVYKDNESDIVVALMGNPNVGKSTIFNALTGLNQHTGNWTGKTVSNAFGKFNYNDENFILVDLPGTYSLSSNSKEEEIARDFVCYKKPMVTIVVVDATSIEKSMNLVLQVIELTDNVIMCINLIDEANKKNISIDIDALKEELNIPVVTTSARNNNGLDKLIKCIYDSSKDNAINSKKMVYNEKIEESIKIIKEKLDEIFLDINTRWLSIKLLSDDTIKESIKLNLNYDIDEDLDLLKIIENEKNKFNDVTKDIIKKNILEAERMYIKSVTINNINYDRKDRKIDKLLTSKLTGIPIMILLFAFIFWLTIVGANYPSKILSNILFGFEDKLYYLFTALNIPIWIKNPIVYGVYRTLSWVVSVMLPPMAIFFPLFTLLEDSGYLPRIAFNMDKLFSRACAHGKQSLTMCMGFGCNACGVVGARIIDSKRERLIAILTNNFVPCNGRFPTLITLIVIFFASSTIGSSLLLISLIILAVIITLLISKFLSKTILKGMSSSFILELPPYRKPQIGKVIIRSILDMTLYVLGRAIVVAAPMGLIIWLTSNININGVSILKLLSNFLDPFASFFGLDGVILLAFILGFPANEIVLPIAIMAYMQESKLLSLDIVSLKTLLIDNGWTWVTALCTMIFSIFHFPCGTTCLTIKKETGSIKWMIASIILPTIVGLCLCFLINLIF